MRFLMKWLKPDVVPSPRRKNIPFGTRVQLLMYRQCLKRLRKWYSKYAFSDSVILTGKQSLKITHEYRDFLFESELKRLHLQSSDSVKEILGTKSYTPEKCQRRRYLSYFCFEDHFLLEIDGRKISIEHNRSQSFNSSFKGQLKGSDGGSLLSRYIFSCSFYGNNIDLLGTGKQINAHTVCTTDDDHFKAPTFDKRPAAITSNRRPESLFGEDPLYGYGKVQFDRAKQAPFMIKELAGVTIDETF